MVVKIKVWLKIITIVILLLATNFVVTTQAAPPKQDPRPPIGGPIGPPSGGEIEDKEKWTCPPTPTPPTCGLVSGQIINWGYRPEPAVPVVLNTGSWQLSTVSTGEGNYELGHLGIGVAKLNVLLAPEDPLRPFIRDAAVYLTCDFPTVANMALYSGPTLEPPVRFDMSASSNSIAPDKRIEIILTIKNDLPTQITNVILTNLMPFGLEALEVSTSAEVLPENLRIIDGGDDGQLVAVYLDQLAAGAKETVTLTMMMIEDALLDAPVTNTATLFYRESVAMQASLDFEVGPSYAVIPAAAVQSEAAEFAPAISVVEQPEVEVEAVSIGQTPASRPRPSAAKIEVATPAPKEQAAEVEATEESPASTDEFLPVTGRINALDKNSGGNVGTWVAGEPNLVGPLSGIGLVFLALVAYTWRSLYRRSEE